MKHKMAYKFAA